MAILKVAQMGHPILRRIADPVDPTVINSEGFQALCDDMLETLDEYEGVGLAGPQVHYSMRVALLILDEKVGPEFMINPVVTVLSDTTSTMTEGCLSIEGLRARVERPDHITVDFLDRMGQTKHYELEGFPAIVTQHELDHLDGKLFVDRCELNTLAFIKEIERWGVIGDEDPSIDEETMEFMRPDIPDDIDDIDDIDDEATIALGRER